MPGFQQLPGPFVGDRIVESDSEVTLPGQVNPPGDQAMPGQVGAGFQCGMGGGTEVLQPAGAGTDDVESFHGVFALIIVDWSGVRRARVKVS